jgi:nucleotide-binding universal stress UspA family protein
MSADVTNSGPRIVVGVDGSPSSRAALRWAVRYAGLSGGTVHAVMAWYVPSTLGSYPWASLDEADDLHENSLKALQEVVRAEVEADDSHLTSAEVLNGHPAEVLLRAAADADLLVLGSRGHGRFADALLGSVAQHCVHHAHCPVLIMRHPSARA